MKGIDRIIDDVKQFPFPFFYVHKKPKFEKLLEKKVLKKFKKKKVFLMFSNCQFSHNFPQNLLILSSIFFSENFELLRKKKRILFFLIFNFLIFLWQKRRKREKRKVEKEKSQKYENSLFTFQKTRNPLSQL